MTTHLDKILKRELAIDGRAYIAQLSPEGLKLTLKGKRNGVELKWRDLVSGDAALAVALNASLGQMAQGEPPVQVMAAAKRKTSANKPRRRKRQASGRSRPPPYSRRR
jgi:hypothetical protein